MNGAYRVAATVSSSGNRLTAVLSVKRSLKPTKWTKHAAWGETPGQPSPHSAARKAGVKVSLTMRSRLDVSIASANPFQELKRAWCIQDANRGVCERSWHPQ